MTTDRVALVVATATALLAIGNLAWGISSWRRSGGTLRVHALAYRDVLVIRVFNAGRTTNTIEELAIGGLRNGQSGDDVTYELALPVRLEPGQSRMWKLRPEAEPLRGRWKSMRSGWVSLHLLTGAGRQARADVLPMPFPDLPPAGWNFVPPRVKIYRYEPLCVGLPLVVAASLGASVTATTFLAALVFVYVGNRFLFRTGRPTFARRRFETTALVLSIGLAPLLAARAEGRPAAAELPAFDVMTLVAYSSIAIALAMPGWGERVVRFARDRN